MKREDFSLNAIKFFHFTDFPADSFGSLGARSRNALLSSRWDDRRWEGAGGGREGGEVGGRRDVKEAGRHFTFGKLFWQRFVWFAAEPAQ